MKPIVTGSLIAVAALSMTTNVLLYMRYSSSRPLVTVGRDVISKKQYQDALDYQTQGAVLKKLVLADLINQAAAKAGVTPTDADVDARLADIRRKEPQTLAGAEQDPTRMAALREDLRTQIALENLQIQGVTVTDTEVAAYYEQHKDQFKLPQQARTSLVIADSAVDASEAAGLLQQNIALDVIARQPRLQVVGVNGFGVNWQALPRAQYRKITGTVFRMKAGDVKTIPLSGEYLVVRVSKSATAGVPPLAQVRPEVTRLAKLEKGTPSWMEAARLFQAAKPQFAVARYADYFRSLDQANTAQSGSGTKTASAE